MADEVAAARSHLAPAEAATRFQNLWNGGLPVTDLYATAHETERLADQLAGYLTIASAGITTTAASRNDADPANHRAAAEIAQATGQLRAAAKSLNTTRSILGGGRPTPAQALAYIRHRIGATRPFDTPTSPYLPHKSTQQRPARRAPQRPDPGLSANVSPRVAAPHRSR